MELLLKDTRADTLLLLAPSERDIIAVQRICKRMQNVLQNVLRKGSAQDSVLPNYACICSKLRGALQNVPQFLQSSALW